MRKTACLVVTAVLVLGGGAAFGEDLGKTCKHLNVILDEESTDVDPNEYTELADYFGVEPFDFCWSQEVHGTVQGTWVLCGSAELSMMDPLAMGIGPDLYGNPGVVHTATGDLYTMSYGLSVWDEDVFVAFGGLTRYVGGTCAYQDASGWSTDAPKKYPPSYWIQSVGFLCVTRCESPPNPKDD